MVARFRNSASEQWTIGTLQGYRTIRYKWCMDSDIGIWAADCEVYDAPDPGEGYELIDTAAQKRMPSDEQWRPDLQRWISCDDCYCPDFETGKIYRRKIEPTAVKEGTGNANKSSLCPFVRLAERQGLFFPLSGGELIQIGDVYHHERDPGYVCDIADGLSYAGLHVREVDACLKFYRPVQANECEPTAVTEAKAEPIMAEVKVAVDEPVKFVAHPIQLDGNGVWRFKSTPIQDRSYAVLNEHGHYLQWKDDSIPEYQPEFRQAFTPMQLLQVSVRELGSNIRLRAVEPVDVTKLVREFNEQVIPKQVEPTPTYEVGKVYVHNGRKFRLATSSDVGSDCYCSNQSLEAAVKSERLKTLSEHKQVSRQYYVNNGEEHWKWAFIEIKQPQERQKVRLGGKEYWVLARFHRFTEDGHESRERLVLQEVIDTNAGFKFAFADSLDDAKGQPQEQEPKYVPFKWEHRELLRNRYIREKGKLDHEYQIRDLCQDGNGGLKVWITGGTVSAKVLLRQYEFLDGTPCGKRVEK